MLQLATSHKEGVTATVNDNKSDNIFAYMDTNERETVTSSRRFTDELNMKLSPEMHRMIRRLAAYYGINKSEATRLLIDAGAKEIRKKIQRGVI